MGTKNNFFSGITEILILAILNDHDSYAYEIVKYIKEFFDGYLRFLKTPFMLLPTSLKTRVKSPNILNLWASGEQEFIIILNQTERIITPNY